MLARQAIWPPRRKALLSDANRELDAAALREALLDLHESWLKAKAAEIGITDGSGFAIVGNGGLGRREMLPYSDLDLLLLHDGKDPEMLSDVADQLWYPLWDANIRLDHSVRTVSEAVDIAGSDMTAALGLLEARHIAGEEALSSELIDGVRRQWRTGIRSRIDELVEMTQARWRRCGRIFNRAEPDLKSGRGGLRDVQLLDALAIAQLIDRHGIGNPDMPAGSLDSAHLTLLDVRTELHRVSGRGRDQLLAQFGDEISAILGVGDRFALSRMLSDAGRTISYHSEAGLRTAVNALPQRGLTAMVRRPKRRPLDEGVVEYAGEIVLALDVKPEQRSRPGAAGGRRVGRDRLAHRLGHAEPAGRHRAGPADPVAEGVVGRPAGRPVGRSRHGERDRNARPHRAVGPAAAGMGRGPRPSAARRLAQVDGGPPHRRDRRQRRAADHPRGAIGPAGDRCAACTTSARAGASITACSGPTW